MTRGKWPRVVVGSVVETAGHALLYSVSGCCRHTVTARALRCSTTEYDAGRAGVVAIADGGVVLARYHEAVSATGPAALMLLRPRCRRRCKYRCRYAGAGAGAGADAGDSNPGETSR